jgi:hypothetical protein
MKRFGHIFFYVGLCLLLLFAASAVSVASIANAQAYGDFGPLPTDVELSDGEVEGVSGVTADDYDPFPAKKERYEDPLVKALREANEDIDNYDVEKYDSLLRRVEHLERLLAAKNPQSKKQDAVKLSQGWHQGPLPNGTFNWGAIVEKGMSPSAGFMFADFRGNHVIAYGAGEEPFRMEADQIGYYNNGILHPIDYSKRPPVPKTSWYYQPDSPFKLASDSKSDTKSSTTEYRSRYGGLFGRSTRSTANGKATTELRDNTGLLLQRSTTTAKWRGHGLPPGVIQPLRK